LIQDFEQAPIADPVAVVAPGEIARGLLAAAHRIHSQPGAEGEMLDIERHIEGEPLASRPAVVRPLDDGRIGVPGMAGKLQHRDLLPSSNFFATADAVWHEGPAPRARHRLRVRRDSRNYGGPAGSRFFRDPDQSDRTGRSRQCGSPRSAGYTLPDRATLASLRSAASLR